MIYVRKMVSRVEHRLIWQRQTLLSLCLFLVALTQNQAGDASVTVLEESENCGTSGGLLDDIFSVQQLICQSDNFAVKFNTAPANQLDDDVADIMLVEIQCMTGSNKILFSTRQLWGGVVRLGPGQAQVNKSIDDLPANLTLVPGTECRIVCISELEESMLFNIDDSSSKCTVQALPPMVDQANIRVHEGDELNLVCINPNNPDDSVSLKWLDMDGNTVSTNATYTIETTTRNDTGVYTCVLTGVNNYTKEKNATVEVLFVPELWFISSQQYAFIGDNFTFTCAYVGVPAPKISWFHDDVLMRNDTDDIEIVNEEAGYSELVLINVELPRSSGNYTCLAENSLGNKSITISVDPIEKIEPNVNPNPSTPAIHSSVTIGDSVTLLCDYNGLPTPIVTWIHDGEILSNETGTILITDDYNGTSSLTLFDFRNKNASVYTCEARNSAGNDSTQFTVIAMDVTTDSRTDMTAVSRTEMTTDSQTDMTTVSRTEMTTDSQTEMLTDSTGMIPFAVIVVTLVVGVLIILVLAILATIFLLAMARRRQLRWYEEYHKVNAQIYKFHDNFDLHFEPGIRLDKPHKSISRSLETLIFPHSFSEETQSSSDSLDKQDDSLATQCLNQVNLSKDLDISTTTDQLSSSGYQGVLKDNLSLSSAPLAEEPITNSDSTDHTTPVQCLNTEHSMEDYHKENDKTQLSVHSSETETFLTVDSDMNAPTPILQNTSGGISSTFVSSSPGYIQNQESDHQNHSGYVQNQEFDHLHQTANSGYVLDETDSQSQEANQPVFNVVSNDAHDPSIVPQPIGIVEENSTTSADGYIQETQYGGVESHQHLKCLDQPDTSASSAGYVANFEDSLLHSSIPSFERTSTNEHEWNIAHSHAPQTLDMLYQEPVTSDDQNYITSPTESTSVNLTLPEFTDESNAVMVGSPVKDLDNTSVKFYFPKVSVSNVATNLNPIHENGMNSLPEQTHLDCVSTPLVVSMVTDSSYITIPDVQHDHTTTTTEPNAIFSNQSEVSHFLEDFSVQDSQQTTEASNCDSDGYVQHTSMTYT